MKKILPLLLISLLLLLSLSACTQTPASSSDVSSTPGESSVASSEAVSSEESQADEESAEATGETGEREITFWTIQLSPDFDEYINGEIEKFEAANEGVTVTWQDVPFDGFENKLLTSAVSGELPDVININIEWMQKVAQQGALVQVDDLVTEEQKSLYFETVWNSSSYDGVVYAVPWYLSNSIIAYNTEIIEEAGLDPDNPPTTYDEIFDWSLQITEKTGKFGYMNDSWWPKLFAQHGVQSVSDDGTKTQFNTPEAKALLEKLKELYDAGSYSQEVLMETKQVYELYNAEETAFYITGPQLLRNVSEDIAVKTQVSGALVADSGVIDVSIMNLAVSSTSSYPQTAMDFILYMTGDESMIEFCKAAPGILPPTKTAIEDPYFTDLADSEDIADIGRLIAAEQLDHAISLDVSANNISDINTKLKETVQAVLVDGKDIDQALEELDEEATALLNDVS